MDIYRRSAITLALAMSHAGLAHADLPYDSAFTGYKKFEEPPRAPWPLLNQQVERIGGWRFYANEALGQTPTQPQALPLSPPTGLAPAPATTAPPQPNGPPTTGLHPAHRGDRP